jgi:ribosomal protein S18 acetylase RimI-like enzyme
MHSDWTIRPYQPADRQAIRVICFCTGFMGESADLYWRDVESFCDIWTAYYTDQEPESTFVVVRSGEVVGYLLGCVDTSKAPSPDSLVIQQMKRRLLPFRSGTAGFFWRAFWDVLYDRSISASELHETRWPSHLHIDLLAEARGLGAGKALIQAWFERLTSAGSPGCHLATMAENTPAIAFFESAGFRRYGPPTLIPGLRTPDRKRMHQQVMVREVNAPSSDLPQILSSGTK